MSMSQALIAESVTLDDWWRSPEEGRGRSGETWRAFLDRHKVRYTEDGYVTLYHGTVRTVGYDRLSPGSFLADTPQEAKQWAFFQARQRYEGNKGKIVLEVRPHISQLDWSGVHFISTESLPFTVYGGKLGPVRR